MNQLSLSRNTIQSFCNVLRPMLSTEIMVIDENLIAVAGTGQYKKNVGTRRPRDSYVHKSIMYGESFEIEAPKETRECMRCEIRSMCPYSSVISSPIKYADRVVGIFGLLGYTHHQKRVMTDKALCLSRLSDEIADLMADMFVGKASDQERLLGSDEMTRIISSVEEGLILTDRNSQILNINEFGEKLLGAKRSELLGRSSEFLGQEIDMCASEFGKLENAKGASRKLSACRKPIKPDCPKDGHIIVFRHPVPAHAPKRTYVNAARGLEFIGRSEAVSELKDLVKKISKSSSTVLITGETGTGKELVASLVHYESLRKYNPFITINCSAVPDVLFESEVFGYSAGAFTGAHRNGKMGRFEMADKGTLFLDEIGYLSLDGQSKILRFLDNCVLEKVGGLNAPKIDVRIIAATNKNLNKMVQEKSFLEDLYFRLNVIPLHVPPLRDRLMDIPLLLEHFLGKTNQRLGHAVQGFSPEALAFLFAYQWPGNVRELKNIVEYVCNIRDAGLIELDDLPSYLREQRKVEKDRNLRTVDQVERLLVEEAIRLFGNSTKGKRAAAAYLGVSMATLYRRLSAMSRSKDMGCAPPQTGKKPSS
ncbi:MAG: sigma 54-interacting transcriptional regulator [Deltaproteobacteria bacterium]|nr:sigma 54-interacting transcriptional regulator [Deltaproteobacteria bacterium]